MASSKAAQSCTQAAAQVQHARNCSVRGFAVETQPAEHLQIHLLEHCLAIQGIQAPAKEPEVHVEGGAPGSVVRARFLIVALKGFAGGARGRGGRTERGAHQSNLRRRELGSIRVMPPPMLISEWSAAGGSFLICVYHPCSSSRNTCMAVMRAISVGWGGRSALAAPMQFPSMFIVGTISRSTRCSTTVRNRVHTSADVRKKSRRSPICVSTWTSFQFWSSLRLVLTFERATARRSAISS